jgi:hypothetical protein
LRFSFRPYQVRQTLHSGEIKLSVLKGSSREFPRFCGTEALDSAKRREHRCHDRMPPVELKLCHILPSFASRPWKPQHQSIIDRL